MPQLSITKKEFVELFNNLNTLGHLKGPRFVYVIAKNIMDMQPEIKALQEAGKPSEAFLEYDEKRMNLAKEYADKNPDTGEPEHYTDINGMQKFKISNKKVFQEKWEELKKEYKEAIEDFESINKTIESMLEEKIEIYLLGLEESDLPEDISVKELSSIMLLMKE